MKRYLLTFLIIPMIFVLTACSPTASTSDTSVALTPSPEERHLILEERRYTYTGEQNDIAIANDRLILQSAGTYRISGTLKEGSLVVRVAPDESVRLILAGVSVQSSYHAPLQIERAACVTLELEKDRVNTFTDAARIKENQDDFLPVACIEAYSPIILTGEGALIVSGRAACALSCAESLWVHSGQITLSAPETGLWIRDRFHLQDGAITVTSAQYGVIVSESDDAVGVLEVSGGRLSMVCSEIALSAGKRIHITAGEGSLRAPVFYRCEKKSNGNIQTGILRIESSNFPSPQ